MAAELIVPPASSLLMNIPSSLPILPTPTLTPFIWQPKELKFILQVLEKWLSG